VGVDVRGFFWIAERIPVTLKSGANEITVPIPPLYGLEVRGTPKERFRISPQGPDKDLLIQYWTVEKDGRVAIERLPAGTYEVSGYKDGKSWKQTITLPGQATLQIP